MNDADKTIEVAGGKSKREIGGLEERLYGLDKLCCDAKLIVRDQTDLASVSYHLIYCLLTVEF